MILEYGQVIRRIEGLIKNHELIKETPHVTRMHASYDMFLPSKEFFEKEFHPHFRSFVAANDIAGDRYYCEGMAHFAMGVMSQCARMRTKKTGVDAAAAFFMVGIHINKPIFKGGLDFGPHLTNMVMFSDQVVAIFEPQNPEFAYVELNEALHSIDISDIVTF
jgi:hypothetical protein